MKKITLLLIALILTMGLIAQVTLLKGRGTSDNPYLITSIDGLKFMRDKVNGGDTIYLNKNFKLINDLDFTGMGDWVPIGKEYATPFIGIFDGNNKVVRHIRIGSQNRILDVSYAGLFGYINKGIINNLGVEWDGIFVSVFSDCSMTGVGGITGGIGKGTLINCFTTGDIYSTSDKCSYIGGIAGQTYGSNIINCYSACSISSSSTSSSSVSYCGGITGIYYSGTIENCYASGSVHSKANSSSAAGIAGCSYLVMGLPYISNCFALNDTIVAIGPTTTKLKSPFVSRISFTTGSCRFGANYASHTIIMKRGESVDKLELWNDFEGIDNGETMTTQDPLIFLNNWIKENSLEYKGLLSLKTWKLVNGANRGFPIFNDVLNDKKPSSPAPKSSTSAKSK